MFTALKRLLGKKISKVHLFHIGDRAINSTGTKYTVIQIESHPEWTTGGWLWTIRDDGKSVQHPLHMHELTPLIEHPVAGCPFQLGDRVGDKWGNRHTVIRVNPNGNELGEWFMTLRDDGHQQGHSKSYDHDLFLLPPNHREFQPKAPDPIQVRSHPEESDASAYLREGKVYFHGICSTNCGGIGTGPFRCVSIALSDTELGTTLLEVLAEAHAMPVPKWGEKSSIEPLFTLAALSGRSASARFDKTALSCYIRQTPDSMQFIQMEYNRGSFMHLDSNSIDGHEPAVVGRALREAFGRCINKHIRDNSSGTPPGCA